MLPEELVGLAQEIARKKCELQNIELKKAASGAPTRLYGTLSSFSNQKDGGIIIFGIDEKDDYKVTGVYDAQDLQKKVTEQAMQMEPPSRPLFTVAEIEGKLIVSAEIAECDIFDKPCFYRGAGRMRGSYIRVGDADLPMTEYEVYSYEAFKRNIQDELRIVGRADLNALDSVALGEYLVKIRREKPNLSGLADEQILQLQGITEKGVPTVAGIMLLGMYPQAFFPQLSITAVVVPGTEIGQTGDDNERFIDNKRFEGTIPEMLGGALSFVHRNMRTKTIIDDEGRRKDKPEYPLKAVREIILNALIHRDYSIHTDSSPIRLIMFNDRLELENPGGLYGRITVDNLGKIAADTRNPFIAGALEIMIDTENRFSGIPTIRHELKKAGLPPPVFENQRGVFKVILFKKQELNFQEVTGSLEAQIIAFCNEPRTREELARRFNFKAVSYLVSRYIMPLVAEGKLKMTLPQTPKSKNQRFIKA